jgi:parallel beta-helix repeat protein
MKILQIGILSIILVLLFSGITYAATNVSSCQVINSGGEYVMNTSLAGAPVEATPSGTACIRINSSDVSLDCAGFTITENGTLGTKTGINIGSGVTNITVMNCPNVSNYDHGFYVATSTDVTLRNNTAYNNTQHGFILVSNANNNVLEDNNAIDNGFHGFRFQDASNAVVTNNTATGNSQYGFYLLDGSNSSNFTDNVVSGGNTGFYIDDSGSNRFIGNNVSSTSSRGFFTDDTSSHNTISNNVLSGGTSYGMRINDEGSNTITGNTVYGYSQHGIYVFSSDYNTINENNASNNGRAGIYISNSDNTTINDNNVTYNDYYGIHLSSSHNNTLLRNNATGNGDMPTTFHLSQKDISGTWNELYSAPFPIKYATKEFQFDKTGDSITLRIVQNGPAPYADVEAARLYACGSLISPTYAKYVDSGESVLEDIVEIDNNVVIAHEKEIEVSWDIPSSCNDAATLYLTANEYLEGLPMYFPDAGFVPVSEETAVPTIDGLLTETDGIISPTYTVYWTPNSGHPDGYTYIYTSQDEDNVYISLDLTSDNTNEYGLDWAQVTFLTADGEKSFKIDDYNDEYGKCGFGLTSKVSYKHQTCELSIPKSEIASEDLLFMLEYYGTESLTASAIALESSDNNTLTSNTMRATMNGYGGYLHYSDNNDLTNNTASHNEYYGMYVYRSNNTVITNDRYFNNTPDLYVSSSGSYILNLSNVVFDNPLGNLVNYTTLSLNDVIGSAIYSIAWDAVPPSPPYNSVRGKSVNITNVTGNSTIDRIRWHYSSGDVGILDENTFQVWKYNSTGNWSSMGASLNTDANTLTLTNFIPASIYSILADLYVIPPSGGGGKSKKPMTVEYGAICPDDSIEVNVTTSGGDALENADVRLIYQLTTNVTDKKTNSSGSVLFTSAKAGDYKLVVDRSGYEKEVMDFTYSACPEEEEEKPPEPPPEKPPVTPPTTPPANVTPESSVNVSDQNLTDSTITIDDVYLNQSGCVVIHAVNADGSPGKVVGKSSVFGGNKTSMELSLINYSNETNLMAMLYFDNGDGICDPVNDEPAEVNNIQVMDKFKVTLPSKAPPAKPTEPEKPTPPAAPDKPTEPEGDDMMGLFLMLLLILILLGGAAAAYYFFGKGGKK